MQMVGMLQTVEGQPDDSWDTLDTRQQFGGFPVVPCVLWVPVSP